MPAKSSRGRTALRYVGGLALLLVAVAVGYALRAWQSAPPPTDHQHEMAAAEVPHTQVWTCSMHPQIQLPKPGKCPICGMDLIPLAAGSEEQGGLRELTISEDSAKLMEIETVPVERRFVTAEVRMVGKIDYDETRVSYITAWVAGRLDRLFVDYTGVPVKRGDHMVSLYSPDLLSAQEELLQAAKAVEELKNSNMGIVLETAKATVVAAREKLRLWGLTPEQIAGLEARGKPEDHITIYAPAGGIVVHKNAQQGMYVSTGTRIYTIADLSQVWVHLDAYESDLAWLRYGQPVEFTTEANPGEAFKGTISFIQPVLDEATRTVKVRVNVPNPDGRLKPGMFVRAVVQAKMATEGRVMDAALAGKWISPMHPEIVKDSPGACDICGMPLVRAESLGFVGQQPGTDDRPLVIPATAVLHTGKRAIVYVAVPGKDRPTYEGREIVLGARAGDDYLVRRGLAVGDRVVTKGSFKLDAELQIRAKPSMMTPAGGAGDGEKPALPAIAESQLREVVAAAEAAVATTDLDPARKAYQLLLERVNAVDGTSLAGPSKALWNEYAMRIGNDATEGTTLKTLAQATALAGTTQEHIRAMQLALGLAPAAEKTVAAAPVNPEFKRQLGEVVTGYLAIQAALAKDNAPAASTAATTALAALAKVDMELVQGQDHMDWMQSAMSLKTLLAELSAAPGIEPARATFALLSEQVTVLLARFGVPDGTLYKAWCPMAFAGRGAAWVQEGEAIRNPYFGAAMPGCGEVKEVLK